MNAKQILQNTIESARKQIASIEAELSAHVLDGTPWLIIRVEPNAPVRMLGEWDGRKGWLVVEAVPSHLCGAWMLSEKRADEYVRKSDRENFIARMHVNDFKRRKRTGLDKR